MIQMGRNRKKNRETNNDMDAIKENSKTIAENSQTIVENTARTNEKLDDMKKDVTEIRKNKVGTIIAIITLLVTISGVSVAGVIDWLKSKTELEAVIVVDESKSASGIESEPEPEYTIYLYPEYSKFNVGFKVDMTASLNFDADSVSITAHLASGREDTVKLKRKNEKEWQNKVVFDEAGVHEIVVSATASNGEVIENSVEVEVTPISINADMNIDMDAINQLFSP